MPRWRALPDELDPQVRELASRLRRLVDDSGLSVSAVADRTGYGKTSWERYLGGRLLPPREAVEALAELTDADTGLLTLWELAERAWNSSEAWRDAAMDPIRASPPPPPASPRTPAPPPPPAPAPAEPDPVPRADSGGGAARADVAGTAGGGSGSGSGATTSESGAGSGTSADRTEPPAGAAARPGGARRRVLLVSGIVGALLVIAAAVLLFGFGGEEGDDAKPPPLPPSTTSAQPDPPAGVKCGGETCTGADPEEMGCGGEHARTVGDARVGATFVEVRYSEVCRAAWARITEAAPGDSVRITAGGRTESDKAEPGTGPGDAYTRMVAAQAPADAKACATTVAGQEGCTLPSGTATPERTGTRGTDGTAEPDSGE